MPVTDDLADYLAEIRNSVCSRCVERPPGGPPCAPLGKVCGVEMHLPLLVDSVRQVHTKLLGPYQEHARHEICEQCAFLHSNICPCPMDYLAELIVEAVETVDQRANGEPKVSPPPLPVAGLAEIEQAYRHGTGTWSGCDWPTQFGKTGLDLQGCRAKDALLKAEKSRGTVVGEDWSLAARWLAQIEERARQAESRAAAAVEAAAVGNWRQALRCAEHAWQLEFGTGRAIWHCWPLAWSKLLQATAAAFLAHVGTPATWESCPVSSPSRLP